MVKVLLQNVKIPPQDEVLDPRQVLARPTWVADCGVSDRTYPNIGIGQTGQTLGQNNAQTIDQKIFTVVRACSKTGVWEKCDRYYELGSNLIWFWL